MSLASISKVSIPAGWSDPRGRKTARIVVAVAALVFFAAAVVVRCGRNGQGSDSAAVARAALEGVSPDGRLRALVRTDGDARQIAIRDLASGREVSVAAPGGAESYNPVWSPDGKMLAFSAYIDNHWSVCLVGAPGKSLPSSLSAEPLPTAVSGSLFCPSFTSDAASILAHDMDSLYQFDLKGNIISAFATCWLTPDAGSFSSDTRALLLEGGKKLVFNYAETGTGQALYVVSVAEIGTAPARRLTPQGVDVAHFAAAPNAGVLYTVVQGNDAAKSFFYVDLSEGNVKPLGSSK